MDHPKLIEYLKHASRIFIFTGAGISTNCGIPDFRGPNGLWKQREPVMFQDFMTSEAARIEYWDQKLEGFPAFQAAIPSPTHKAIAKLEKADKLELLVTQNIDGLHTKAGNSSDKIVEIHGTNGLVQCMSCWETTDPLPHYQYFKQHGKTPLCRCGGWLKPATISFGQNLWPADLKKARKGTTQADLVIALGSTLSVYPAAEFPLMAAQNGVPYIIINRGPTDHDKLPQVTLRLEGDVDGLFPEAVQKALV